MNVWAKPICCFLLAWDVFADKSSDNFMDVPFNIILFSHCDAFTILSSFIIFYHFVYDMSCVNLFMFIMFETVYVSCTCISVSFFSFGNFSAIIISNIFLIPVPLSLLFLEPL